MIVHRTNLTPLPAAQLQSTGLPWLEKGRNLLSALSSSIMSLEPAAWPANQVASVLSWHVESIALIELRGREQAHHKSAWVPWPPPTFQVKSVRMVDYPIKSLYHIRAVATSNSLVKMTLPPCCLPDSIMAGKRGKPYNLPCWGFWLDKKAVKTMRVSQTTSPVAWAAAGSFFVTLRRRNRQSLAGVVLLTAVWLYHSCVLHSVCFL